MDLNIDSHLGPNEKSPSIGDGQVLNFINMALNSATINSLSEWRRFSNEACGIIDVSSSQSTPFRAEFLEVTAGDVTLFETRTGPQKVSRLSSHITENTPKYCKLYLQLEGESQISQNGRHCIMGPGDLTLFVINKPYTLDYRSNQHCLIVYFPQSYLGMTAKQIDSLTATPLSRYDDFGAVAVSLFEQLASNPYELNKPHGESIIQSALSMFATALQAKVNHGMETSSGETRLFIDASTFIEENLGSPSLSPKTVADQLFVSLRRLQKAFAVQQESVAAYIKHKRLECFRNDLGSPECREQSIMQIATRYGMDDPAYVSRAFKHKYGEPPRAYRKKALAERSY